MGGIKADRGEIKIDNTDIKNKLKSISYIVKRRRWVVVWNGYKKFRFYFIISIYKPIFKN